MNKSVTITIMIDDVKLSDLEELEQAIEDLVDDYENKRIITTIQDEKLVSFR